MSSSGLPIAWTLCVIRDFYRKGMVLVRSGIVLMWYGDITVEDGLGNMEVFCFSNRVKIQLPMNPACHVDICRVRLPEIGSQISLPSYEIFLMPYHNPTLRSPNASYIFW